MAQSKLGYVGRLRMADEAYWCKITWEEMRKMKTGKESGKRYRTQLRIMRLICVKKTYKFNF